MRYIWIVFPLILLGHYYVSKNDETAFKTYHSDAECFALKLEMDSIMEIEYLDSCYVPCKYCVKNDTDSDHQGQ